MWLQEPAALVGTDMWYSEANNEFLVSAVGACISVSEPAFGRIGSGRALGGRCASITFDETNQTQMAVLSGFETRSDGAVLTWDTGAKWARQPQRFSGLGRWYVDNQTRDIHEVEPTLLWVSTPANFLANISVLGTYLVRDRSSGQLGTLAFDTLSLSWTGTNQMWLRDPTRPPAIAPPPVNLAPVESLISTKDVSTTVSGAEESVRFKETMKPVVQDGKHRVYYRTSTVFPPASLKVRGLKNETVVLSRRRQRTASNLTSQIELYFASGINAAEHGEVLLVPSSEKFRVIVTLTARTGSTFLVILVRLDENGPLSCLTFADADVAAVDEQLACIRLSNPPNNVAISVERLVNSRQTRRQPDQPSRVEVVSVVCAAGKAGEPAVCDTSTLRRAGIIDFDGSSLTFGPAVNSSALSALNGGCMINGMVESASVICEQPESFSSWVCLRLGAECELFEQSPGADYLEPEQRALKSCNHGDMYTPLPCVCTCMLLDV